MKQTIINYLRGPRDYQEGVRLYEAYGHNRAMKQMFVRLPKTESLYKSVIEELRKLAGLTVTELAQMKRLSADAVAKLQKEQEPETPTVTPTVTPSAEGIEMKKKVDGIRSKFPFLSDPSCPDVLKVLVADMFTAYGKYKDAHEKLQSMPDDADLIEAQKLARDTVEAYIENREIWEELEYYKENKELLGKCDKVKELLEAEDITKKDDTELLKALQSARAQISKAKTKLKNADEDKKPLIQEQLDKWEAQKALIEAEQERRKKN